MAATARLNRIWRCNTISFASKFKLSKSLLTSVLLYGCETWTLLTDSEKRTKAFETKRLRKLLRISVVEHQTNDWMHSKINFLLEPLLAAVKRRKHACSSHDSLFKTILWDTLEGGRHRGQQRKCCQMEIIKEWTSLPVPELLTRASCRKDWSRISAKSSLMSHRRPNRSRH